MTEANNPARYTGASPALMRVLVPVLLMSGAAASDAQPRTERVEHAVEIAEGTMVTVMNFAGHVDVHGTDPGEDSTLRVVGVKRLTADLPPDEAGRIFERINLDPRKIGGRIHIGPEPLRRRGPGRSGASPRPASAEIPITEIRAPRIILPVSVDLELWLPDGASLEVRTFTAPIAVTGVASPEGTFFLRSLSGDLTVSNLRGRDLRTETVSGDLTVTDLESRGLRVETTSGELRLRSAVAQRATLETLNAAIHLDGELHPKGWYEFQTHSGAVVLGLGSLPAFQLDVRTFAGEIRNDLEVEAHAGPRSVEIVHGEHGPRITGTTFDGLIHLADADAVPPTLEPQR